MTSAKIFIGNIYTITACTILEEEVTVNHRTYKINKQQQVEPKQILIKLKENEFIRLTDFQTYFYLRNVFPTFFKEKIIQHYNINKLKTGYQYIKEEELVPYIKITASQQIKIPVSLRRIKKKQAK